MDTPKAVNAQDTSDPDNRALFAHPTHQEAPIGKMINGLRDDIILGRKKLSEWIVAFGSGAEADETRFDPSTRSIRGEAKHNSAVNCQKLMTQASDIREAVQSADNSGV